jgi:hypothetical protein
MSLGGNRRVAVISTNAPSEFHATKHKDGKMVRWRGCVRCFLKEMGNGIDGWKKKPRQTSPITGWN